MTKFEFPPAEPMARKRSIAILDRKPCTWHDSSESVKRVIPKKKLAGSRGGHLPQCPIAGDASVHAGISLLFMRIHAVVLEK